MTFDGSNTFTYGDHGRMSTLVNTAGTLTYSYNALGQRVAKSGPATMVPTGAAYYVYDQGGHLLGEYDANASPLYESIYLDSTDNAPPVGVIKLSGSAASSTLSASLYNVYSDQINTPRVITRQSDEAIVWRWDSAEAFGASAPDQNPNALGTFTVNQRFPGQLFDAESGLSQNWNREYNARTGRYIQSDPIGLRGGIKTYGCAEANPLSFTDPTGEIVFIPIVIGIGVGYAFDYALAQYKKEHCTCKDTPTGAAGKAAAGGAVGGLARLRTNLELGRQAAGHRAIRHRSLVS